MVPETILIATSDLAYGELLRTGLMDSGRYSVTLAASGSELLSLAASCAYDLAILDAELPGEPFAPLVMGLTTACPKLKIMIVPPDNNPRHARLTGLTPHGYIFNPFFLPDLLDGIASVLAARNGLRSGPLLVKSALGAEGLSWVDDPQRAGQILARLVLQTDASAALIVFEGKLWASAGQLSGACVQEVASGLGDWWQGGQKLDLARYVRLHSTGGETLVYSTALLDQLVLALVYPGGSALTRARAQSAQIVDELGRQAAESSASADADADYDDLDNGEATFDLSSILADMPSPDPQPGMAGLEWVREEDLQSASGPVGFPWESTPDPDWRSLLETPAEMPEENCYSCVMLPARADQQLTGEMLGRLGQWVRQCCTPFGWKLTGLSIQPEYMQFSVLTGPDGLGAQGFDGLSLSLSERIFKRYPNLRAGDADRFWAPEFLESAGTAPIPVESLRQFITEARQQQQERSAKPAAIE